MKTKLIVLGIILGLLGVIYFLFGALKDSKNETKIYKKDFFELSKEHGEVSKVLVLTKKELKLVLPKIDSFAKANKILTKDLKEIHTIKYVVKSGATSKTDTIYILNKYPIGVNTVFPHYFKDTIEPKITYYNDYKLSWYFDHGCFQSIVTYDPNTNMAIDTLIGEIEINRTIVYKRPKYWFWLLKWRKSKWENETKVISNCNELQIKENTLIEVR